MKKSLQTKDNREVIIEISPPANIDSFFVFALRKSGSVLQDKVFEDIAAELNLPLVSVAKAAFSQGVEEGNFAADICELFVPRGYGYYGFRYFPGYLKDFDLREFKKVFLIRDPRDILVSHYFSMKNSHVIPQGQMGDKLREYRQSIQQTDINEYVLKQAPIFYNYFLDYFNKVDSQSLVFRYEDIVFNKDVWISDILSFLNLDLPPSKIKSISQKHDVFPNQESPQSHIRKVTPGDHREKLKSETIESLNKTFRIFLDKYNYDL